LFVLAYDCLDRHFAVLESDTWGQYEINEYHDTWTRFAEICELLSPDKTPIPEFVEYIGKRDKELAERESPELTAC
jgi:hypothetical protein